MVNMKNGLLTLIFLLTTVVQAMAADNMAQLWSKGTKLYQQKEYDSAAAYFEKIALLKPRSADVYYNLGNTYYRLNKIGSAVLNYERALQIKPNFDAAKDNLMLTQNRMSTHVPQGKDIFFVTWWNNLTAASMATLWAMLAFIIFSATILMIFLKGVSKIVIHIPTQIPAFLVFVWICLLVLAYNSARNAENSGLAVIMQNDAPLLSGELKGKPMSLLPEGTTVKITGIRGEYAEVVIPDGRKGYVLQNWLNKI